MLSIRGLWKQFGDQLVLRGIDLDMPSGKTTAIIGRSGCGKTVLLKHCIGLLKPDRGSIYVDEQEISRLRKKELNVARRRFGMLFQSAALFDSLNVFDNVAFPLREKTTLREEEIRRRTRERLRQVDLEEMAHKYPAELSGGMKKRVGLARALVMDPAIILFDEPTTGLDPLMEHAIHRLIRDTQRQFGFTAVVVSHSIPQIFDIAHQVALMYDGQIVAQGTPEELRASAHPVVQQFLGATIEGPLVLDN
ncbi:MAG: ABC transporter ATP-binding protein [Candidatus Tectomicrobia bacterium]|nr:ABC transporter ATP-binding protein [Candidatus Tectomicrobia bacterium]